MTRSNNTPITSIGLGRAVLPLAIGLGKKYPAIRFNFTKANIAPYKQHNVPTGAVGRKDLTARVCK
jgi:hypothetical protein